GLDLTNPTRCADRTTLGRWRPVANCDVLWRPARSPPLDLPLVAAPGQEVEVEVIHDLAALRPAVEREAISARGEPPALSDPLRNQDQPAHERSVLRRERHHGLDVPLRDDQEVDRRLRVDVREGEDLLVLVLEGSGTSAGNDVAEDAVGHGAEGGSAQLAR